MNDKVLRDAYYVIHAKMRSGFECKIPARGYNLKSWLDFETKLGSEFTYERTTEAVYNHLVFGDPGAPIIDEDEVCQLSQAAGTKSKTSTKRVTSRSKPKPATKTATRTRSTTKVSAKPAKKTTPKKAPSSTPKRNK